MIKTMSRRNTYDRGKLCREFGSKKLNSERRLLNHYLGFIPHPLGRSMILEIFRPLVVG